MSGADVKASNPVYHRLTQGRMALPGDDMARVSITLCVLGVGCGAISLIGVVIWGELVTQVLFGFALLLAMCYPLVGFIAAATISARHALSEDFALLRLTRLTGEEIVGAHVAGVQVRLRLFQVAGLWFPAGLALGAGLSLGGYLPPAVLLLSGVALVAVLLWNPAVTGGVWVGFRWARHAATIAGAASAGMLALGAMLALGSLRLGLSTGLIGFMVLALIVALTRKGMERAAFAAAVRCVEGSITG